MAYHIEYSRRIKRKEVAKIPKKELRRIRRAIEEKLACYPDLFGKPLRKSLARCWSLRVGDYRVIYRLEGDVVHVYVIAHRSVAYQHAEQMFVR